MKRGIFVGIVLVFFVFSPTVMAQTDALYDQQLRDSGTEELLDKLPDEARESLEQLGFSSVQPDAFTDIGGEELANFLGGILAEESDGPLQTAGLLLALAVLCVLLGGMQQFSLEEPLRQTMRAVMGLAAGATLLIPLTDLLERVRETAESVSVFLLSYVPVYAGLLVVGGAPTTAASYQTVLLSAVEWVTHLLKTGVLPLLTVSLAFGIVGSVTDGFRLEALSATVHKGVLWIIGLVSALFSGLLSMQQMVTAAGDSLGGRALRFSLSSFVPVVGGTLSEAYATIVGCSGLLRSAVGAFGLLAVAVTVLPTLMGCILWNVSLSLVGGVAVLFDLPELNKMCTAVSGAVKVMIGVLALFVLLMVVGTAVVSFAWRG